MKPEEYTLFPRLAASDLYGNPTGIAPGGHKSRKQGANEFTGAQVSEPYAMPLTVVTG
jgi:hypothetical protein